MPTAATAAFNRSLLKLLNYQPRKSDGTTLDGVFILFSDEIVALLKANLTQLQKDELDSWVNRYSEAQCATWHVPVWAGNTSAVYCRVPAAIWNDPSTAPPQKVKDCFQSLWREAGA